ncbi:MAG: putative rane protein [Gammaproteobacteria bacterium]|nr:putative rane protein [Gammaproteobacteria bacterium]
MSAETRILLFALGALSVWYIVRWTLLERRKSKAPVSRPGALDLLIGFVCNFFDALGIGNFATTTAIFKFRRRPVDEDVPGTLNVGYALPTVAEALIFIAAVNVEVTTLVSMIAAAVLGALSGVGLVNRLPRRVIQVGMGVALLIAAMLLLATNLNWMPGGGNAEGLTGGRLILAVSINFMLGALNTLGIGLYAPCLILCSLLGMSALASFPIMMGACAFLMPTAGTRFIRAGRYDLRASLGLTLGGIPGVLAAAFIVKSLPLLWLRWLVVIVVTYAATLMLLSTRRRTRIPRLAGSSDLS